METCYRHPGRETGVSCSNCGRPICTDCMTSTSVGMRCPECARQKTKVRTASSFSPGDPVVTYVLIAVNVVVALGGYLSGATAGAGVGGSRLMTDGELVPALVDRGDLWRLVTSGFLHAGIFHLLFNMYALYVLGSMLEPAIGRLRFGIIYFVSLLAGSFGALVLSGPLDATVGASGAVFGLMGAAVVILRNRGINPMESGLGFIIGLNLLFSFAIPGISIGGHVGGLIGGALVAFVMSDLVDRVRMPAAAPLVLSVLIGVAAVVGSIAVVAGTSTQGF